MQSLQHIRVLTQVEGALLILDEVKTGFRVGLAGVQGLYDIKPDLTLLSKAIANGFPLSVVMGRAEIMDLSGSARIMGTYNNELLSVAAAIKTISILERPLSIPSLWQIGQDLINGINGILNQCGLSEDVQAVSYRWPCMPYIWFHGNSELAQRLKPQFYRSVTDSGLLMCPNHMNFTCLAHSRQDIEDSLQIIEDAFRICLSQIKHGVALP